MNAANEVAVAAFLDGELPFTGIAEVIERALEASRPGPSATSTISTGPTPRRASRPRELVQGVAAAMSWFLAFAGLLRC